MDFILLGKIIVNLFSFKKGNLRFITLRRLIVVTIGLPFFIFLLFVNQVFLLLDYILFPKFTKKEVSKSVFIVALPRSGTTFLYHNLALDKELFTTVKTWEIIFAPSICQKYLAISFYRLDKKLGNPAINFLKLVDERMFSKIKKTHTTGIFLPEEDEAFLIWNIATMYLSFFCPDTKLFDNYMYFDSAFPEKKRKKIMRYYYRYIQRHNYVFNREENKYYLSKNPALCTKLKTLHLFFPKAKMIHVIRNPTNCIPSILNFNSHLFELLGNKKMKIELANRIASVLIAWYKILHKSLNLHFNKNYIDVFFEEMTQNPEESVIKIYSKLGWRLTSIKTFHNNNYQSVLKHNYLIDIKEERLKKELPFLKETYF